MATTTTLKERYAQVKSRIAGAAARAGRPAESVLLVAVTKHAEPEQIRELIHLGHQDFGENRVQHLAQRAAMVEEYLNRRRILPGVTAAREAALVEVGLAPAPPNVVRWHMVGTLQRNKARKAMEFARLIHSVDSLRLAEEIQTIAHKRDLPMPVDVLLQVNCTDEPQKGGVARPAALHVAEQIDTMVQVRLRGLMTMGPTTGGEAEAREAFRRCRDCFLDIQGAGYGGELFNLLSMGMSGDFEWAIEEGANIVRVGSAIFGERAGAEGEPQEHDDDAEEED
jgi:pyridoxal phosphate enzyme (YggS family)